MSWSHSRRGTPSQLLAGLDDARKVTCVEPENGYKNDALEIMSRMLGSYPETIQLDLSCYGSQYEKDGKPVNSIAITLKPTPVS